NHREDKSKLWKKENQIIEMEEEDVSELAPFDPSKNKKPVEPDSLIEENGDAKKIWMFR
ncbi:hypothetical protein MKW98_010268, partial [Papaver atlanticum]